MRDSYETADMGVVNNLAVIKKPGSTDRLLFVGQSKDHERWVRIITYGAAQSLWHYLTQLLYPRAADQLTPRAATAALVSPETPNVITTFVASLDEAQGVVNLRGIASGGVWMFKFSKEDGYELWASLEDILDAV